MKEQTIWTSQLTEEKVKEIWDQMRSRCLWANLGSYEENQEIAWEKADELNEEKLVYLSQDLAECVVTKNLEIVTEEGEIIANDEEENEDDLALWRYVDELRGQYREVSLKVRDEELLIEGRWKDWLAKEEGTDIYTVRVGKQKLGPLISLA